MAAVCATDWGRRLTDVELTGLEFGLRRRPPQARRRRVQRVAGEKRRLQVGGRTMPPTTRVVAFRLTWNKDKDTAAGKIGIATVR